MNVHKLRGLPLSKFEEQVIKAMAAGNTSHKQIATATGRNVRSVQNASSRIQKKVGADTMVHLAFMIVGHMPAPSNLVAVLARSHTQQGGTDHAPQS